MRCADLQIDRVVVYAKDCINECIIVLTLCLNDKFIPSFNIQSILAFLKADQLIYHTIFKMIEIANALKMLEYHSSIHYSGIANALGLVILIKSKFENCPKLLYLKS